MAENVFNEVNHPSLLNVVILVKIRNNEIKRYKLIV